MKKSVAGFALMALMSAPATFSVPAQAAQGYHQRDREYHGSDRRYRHRCKRSSGTTGLVVGGAGGALAGNALGGGTLGTIAGGVGGALLGKHLDKRHDAAQNRKNGC